MQRRVRGVSKGRGCGSVVVNAMRSLRNTRYPVILFSAIGSPRSRSLFVRHSKGCGVLGMTVSHTRRRFVIFNGVGVFRPRRGAPMKGVTG